MTYDIAVWDGPTPADDRAAVETYEAMYDQYIGSAAETTHPVILDFIAELTQRYPDLTSYEDDEDDSECPWGDGPLTNDAKGPFFYFSLTYGMADEVLPFVVDAAHRRNLVVFDPQGPRLL